MASRWDDYNGGKLTDREILKLFKEGKYRADIEEGHIYGKHGKLVVDYNSSGYGFVRLFAQPKRRAIMLSRLIWMIAVNSMIPKNFEIHHRDEDINNNSFENLYCLHNKDHQKLHGRDLKKEENLEDVPF